MPAPERALNTPRNQMDPPSGAPRPAWPYVVVLVAAVLAAYYPSLTSGFVWDDNAHVTAPDLRSLHGLWRIWFEPGATQQHYPLLHSLFLLEYQLWGDAPFGYHLVNVLLHAAVAVLFGLLLRKLAIPGAWFAALVFALHPVCVESVAWVSEQKNTLSALFYLAAALVYLRFDRSRRGSLYALAFGLFGLALLSKTVTASLPAALLVVIWWQRGKLAWRTDVVPLLPWFALAAAAGLLTAWVEKTHIGADGSAFDLTFLQRLLLAARVPWFYLGKLLWPADLMFMYPRWTIDPTQWLQWLPLLAWAAVLAGCWHLRLRTRAPLAACLLFGGTLFPALGFFNVFPFQYSFVADHFQYLASLSAIALVCEGLASIAPLPSRVRLAAGLAVLGALGSSSWKHCHDFRDSPTLWRATLAKNPESWMAHNNLGRDLLARKETQAEAKEHFRRALEARPDYPEALTNYGLSLYEERKYEEAIPYLEKSVALKPKMYQAHNNLAMALAKSGRVEEAVSSFRRAAELNPTQPNLHENWGKALQLLGRNEEANRCFAEAARLRALKSRGASKP